MSRGEIPRASILIRVTRQLGRNRRPDCHLQRALTGAAVARGFQQSFLWAVFFTAIAVPVSCCREDPS